VIRPVGILKAALRRPRMLQVGEKAPDFTVLDHKGQTRRLSDYRGKTVVLWFYPKADTPG
jgi:peroxiredoxin Q/BCP